MIARRSPRWFACMLLAGSLLPAAPSPVFGDEGATPSPPPASSATSNTTTSKEKTSAANREPVDKAQVQRWISELADNNFATREAAEARLIEVGPAALEAVGAAAQDASLERSTRAVRVLLAWSHALDAEDRDSGDRDAKDRVGVLQQLAQVATTHPTEAAQAVEHLAVVREQAVLAEVAKLGAVVMGGEQNGPVQVAIGPHWTGGVEGMKQLADVRRLRILSFYSAPVGDEGLRVAAELPAVRRVEVYGTAHDPQTVEELQTKHADRLQFVVRKSAAQLGIVGDQTVGVALVKSVGKGTAAEKAGIRPGDVIQQINGEKVSDFIDLTNRISEFQPGEKVDFAIDRGGQAVALDVTFDRWGENEDFLKMYGLGGQGAMQLQGQTIIQGNGQIVIRQANGQQQIIVLPANAPPVQNPAPQAPAPRAPGPQAPTAPPR